MKSYSRASASALAEVVGAGDGALRVGGRAQEEAAGAAQDVGLARQRVEIGQMAGLGGGVEIDRLAAGAVGAAEVGLIERIGEQHDGPAVEALAADGRQRREEQAFARAVDGQHLALEVDLAGEAVAPADPGGDRLAQLVGAADLGIGAEQRLGLRQLVGDEGRHRLAWDRRTVISIGFLWPGAMPSSRRAVRVKGDRTAPCARACRPCRADAWRFSSSWPMSAHAGACLRHARRAGPGCTQLQPWPGNWLRNSGMTNYIRPMRTSSSGLAPILWTARSAPRRSSSALSRRPSSMSTAP